VNVPAEYDRRPFDILVTTTNCDSSRDHTDQCGHPIRSGVQLLRGDLVVARDSRASRCSLRVSPRHAAGRERRASCKFCIRSVTTGGSGAPFSSLASLSERRVITVWTATGLALAVILPLVGLRRKYFPAL